MKFEYPSDVHLKAESMSTTMGLHKEIREINKVL
jgi:hypothetical protein